MLESSSTADYDVIILIETWLDNSFFNAEFIDGRYVIFRKDRSQTNIPQKDGGGVLIGIKGNANISHEEVNLDEMTDLEAACVKIKLGSSHLYIYAVYVQYRRVDDTLARFYDDHLKAIEAICMTMNDDDAITICGDFNFGNKITWFDNGIGYDLIGNRSEFHIINDEYGLVPDVII